MAGHKRVVVITGASAGAGRATARVFAREGAKIALVARGLERLEDARREVMEAGGEAVVLQADVADSAQVEHAAEETERRFGPIDVWVNNAMTTVFSPFVDVTPSEYRRATEVTYLGQVYGTMAALRRMRKRNYGTIIQVGSALAYRAIPLQSVYCGAKFACRGFTDSIRSELIHDKSNVHITMVHLPALNTPQFEWCKTRLPRQPQPVPPIYQPEVAADAIYWSSIHRRREVFVGFSTVKAIIGNKFIPGFLDRFLASQAYSGQQTKDEIDAARRPCNLYHAVAGDYAARGRFSQAARQRSRTFWLSTHRAFVAGCLAGLLAGLILLILTMA